MSKISDLILRYPHRALGASKGTPTQYSASAGTVKTAVCAALQGIIAPEDLSDASWEKQPGLVVTPHAGESPVGNIADEISGASAWWLFSGITGAPLSRYTFTVHLRAGTSNFVSIFMDNGAADLYLTAEILSGPGIIISVDTLQQVHLLDPVEWTRVRVTTNIAAENVIRAGFNVPNPDPGSVYIWGAKLEPGVAATPYLGPGPSWPGAICRWDSGANAGRYSTVRDFDVASGTLTFDQPLPATVVAGDTFTLLQGGLYVSDQSIPGLIVSAPVNCTGVSITFAAMLNALGVGTLKFYYHGGSGAQTMSWTPAGGVEGAEVLIGDPPACGDFAEWTAYLAGDKFKDSLGQAFQALLDFPPADAPAWAEETLYHVGDVAFKGRVGTGNYKCLVEHTSMSPIAAWAPSTLYHIGDLVCCDDGSIYRCAVEHTSSDRNIGSDPAWYWDWTYPATSTFDFERQTHPTYWGPNLGLILTTAWVGGPTDSAEDVGEYSVGDVRFDADTSEYYRCLVAHIARPTVIGTWAELLSPFNDYWYRVGDLIYDEIAEELYRCEVGCGPRAASIRAGLILDWQYRAADWIRDGDPQTWEEESYRALVDFHSPACPNGVNWTPETEYSVGDIIQGEWPRRCLVAHTSGTNSMETDVTAHPTWWSAIGSFAALLMGLHPTWLEVHAHDDTFLEERTLNPTRWSHVTGDYTSAPFATQRLMFPTYWAGPYATLPEAFMAANPAYLEHISLAMICELLPGGATDEAISQFLVVARDVPALPTADASDAILITAPDNTFLPPLIGGDCETGLTIYRPVGVENLAAETISAVAVYCPPPFPGAVATTLAAGIGTGADTLVATDLARWGAHGWVYNSTKDDLRYYLSRSGNQAFVLHPGAGLRGKTAVPWDFGDAIEPYPWQDIGLGAPGEGDVFEDPEDVWTPPDGVTFCCPRTAVTGLAIGDLAAAAVCCVWERIVIPAGFQPLLNGDCRLRFYAEVGELLDERYIDLAQRLQADAAEGYRLYARNVDTGVEIYLGFVAADADPPELSGVALADGNYEIIVFLSGYAWPAERQTMRFPVRIVAGEIFTPLPAVAGLTYAWTLTQTNLIWSWLTTPGEETPDDFAIWASPDFPVVTTGDPDYIVPAAGAGTYTQAIAQGAEILYVAACARKGAVQGPFAQLQIPAPAADVAAPDGQAAHY